MVNCISRVHKPLLLRLPLLVRPPKKATFPVCIFFFYFDIGWIQVSCFSSAGFNHKILVSLVSSYPKIMRQPGYYEATALAKPICRHRDKFSVTC